MRACSAAGPPLTPEVPINILNNTGYPVRNNNTTDFSHVGKGDGTTPPERYIPYHPDNPSDTTPIAPGEETIFKNQQTGKYCRLAPLTTQTACASQGMLCDQSSPSDATIMMYTGTGLSYNGVPLVQQPVTGTLVLSSNASCSLPGGGTFTFPPAGQWQHNAYCCSCLQRHADM